MSERVLAVIQARMGSTRLPGKVLRPLGPRPVVDWVVRAARASVGVDEVVLAISDDPADDALEAWAATSGIVVVRGSEHDVLSRFALVLQTRPADAVVRLTADCPLLDPVLIAQAVALWRADPGLDHVSTVLRRTLPRGLDVEVVSAAALRRADAEATGHHRVHVTSALYAGPLEATRAGIVVDPPAADLRVTLDEEADGRLLDALVAELGDRAPSWREVVATLRSRPDLVALNAAVEQKALERG